ncbi:hypothetical protein [Staphylococcus arlettae]|uniref:hypothetical protein n=1 Tax=Staphylococcus arlettae TaxID=29378 RepID=UPI0015FD3D92|nr:hypothetical protein [Staphylococcus arlettae]
MSITTVTILAFILSMLFKVGRLLIKSLLAMVFVLIYIYILVFVFTWIMQNTS